MISLPSFRLAAVTLLVFLFGSIIWRTVFYQSDVDKGLAQLQIGVAGQRLIESRTTFNSNYSPLIVTRGNNDIAINEDALRSAELILSEAAKNPNNAEAQHAWGLVFLVNKNFDKALEKLNLALKLTPDNAKLHSDIGAVYLEKARLAEADDKGDEFIENLEFSLRHIDSALELDKNLQEALFNKALLLQKKGLTNQAREAWKKYLEKDSASPWSDEARRQLQKLDLQKSQNLSAAELEKAFLTAFRLTNEIQASQLISQNREIITEKYIPQRLTMSLVEASGDKKKEYLEALVYAGELEKKYIGDSFAADLAVFYANVSETNLELMKTALALTRDGYKLCVDGQTKEALKKFELARKLFLQAGNIWEAKLSEFFIIYCSIFNIQFKESLPPAEEIINFSRQKNYKWLLSNMLLWQGVAQRKIGLRPQAKISYRESLSLAKEIGDSFMLQSINLELAKLSKFVGQDKAGLNYLYRVFKNADMPGTSLRQKWRNYSDGTELLANVKYYNLAKAVSLENLRLTEELKNSLLINYSQLDVGIMHARAGDNDEAKNWFVLAKMHANSISNEEYRNDISAKSSLELGHLERKIGNYAKAADFYSDARVYDEKSKYYSYEIRKSQLLTHISLGNDAEIEKQIIEVLGLAESYREQMSEEQERDSFLITNKPYMTLLLTMILSTKNTSRHIIIWKRQTLARYSTG